MKKTKCKMLIAGVLAALTSVGSAAFLEDLDTSVLRIDGVEITSSAAELNIMDGVTATAAEINQATNLSAAGMSAAKLTAGTVATAIDGSAITNLGAANIKAAGTLPQLNGAALTALDAANITAGTVLSAVDASAVTNLGIWAEPTFVTDAITAGSLISTSTVTILDLDGNTMTGNTLVHIWSDQTATAMTFPDGVEVEVVVAEEDYWVAITNSGTVQVIIEDSAITTNIVNTSVGPRVVDSTITLLP